MSRYIHLTVGYYGHMPRHSEREYQFISGDNDAVCESIYKILVTKHPELEVPVTDPNFAECLAKVKLDRAVVFEPQSTKKVLLRIAKVIADEAARLE